MKEYILTSGISVAQVLKEDAVYYHNKEVHPKLRDLSMGNMLTIANYIAESDHVMLLVFCNAMRWDESKAMQWLVQILYLPSFSQSISPKLREKITANVDKYKLIAHLDDEQVQALLSCSKGYVWASGMLGLDIDALFLADAVHISNATGIDMSVLIQKTRAIILDEYNGSN